MTTEIKSLINHCRLTALKCWPWKFPWLFELPFAIFGLGNFHGHFGLTPNFWRWKFPSPISVALEYDAPKMQAYFFFYTKSIHLLHFGNIFDISLHSWHDFFFLAIIDVRIRLALVFELIRKTNADRFRRFDDILSSLSRNWRKFT